MDERKSYHFIVIEDSKLDCFICEKIIQSLGPACASLNMFINALEGLEYIRTLEDSSNTILLVDIQMPIMSGFEFIEAFESMVPAEEQGNFIVNILSSSTNEKDISKAFSYDSVYKFMHKPLRKQMLEVLLKELETGDPNLMK